MFYTLCAWKDAAKGGGGDDGCRSKESRRDGKRLGFLTGLINCWWLGLNDWNWLINLRVLISEYKLQISHCFHFQEKMLMLVK